MSSHDPRSSSVQSLGPHIDDDRAGRRRLLLVYIHGFMGNETSFRNFPAHVHNLVSITLAESHVVHSKLYPKYRSRYALEVARDDFSRWLSPHEDRWTDVILLAHSMGGLVAADVALLCRHRIIGVINFDVPFLGMHPGIIKAGLGSIFQPWPEPQDRIAEEPDLAGKRPSRFDTLFNPRPNDPNYNPPFPNDVHLPVRKGWENTLHWLNKHSTGIVQASKTLVRSHLEFGSAMADYRTLKARYVKIRALEEEDERERASALQEVYHPPRIRFVNYYTTSTGRPKKPKSPKPSSPSPSSPVSRASPGPQAPEDSTSALVSSTSQLEIDSHGSEASTISPRTSIESPLEEDILDMVPPTPIEEVSPEPSIQDVPTEGASGPELPDIPPIPQEPPFVDLAQFAVRSQRKAAEKEHDQALKEYQRAVKARNKVINDRDKLQEKWEKQKKKDRQLKEKQAQQAQQNETKQTGKELQQEDKQKRKDLQPAERAKGKDKVEGKQHTELNREDVGAVQLGGDNASHSMSTNGPYGNYDFSRSAIMNQAEPDEQSSYTTASKPPSSYNESMYSITTADSNATDPGPEAPQKTRRLKKFCMLPPEDSKGNKDPTWVRIFMEGIDEVTAHTTLFFVNDTYERLVGEVGARIEDWVSEADSLRLVREMEGL
ncbi:hypothetical protein P171DRAFT_350322 [Karstenula rhodostoma CBS 690.94]|uniref:AB hydrolase-1 domain-containing protein n=1 Tax=Karstenula rhodostoma CBS 690.94 TaxID=1392251 RepID=A0A9P4PVF4_9PLEO|nr:hypothetical protein P171DRAFT_350322 [Karstenula rhodostoma CBS 690.94]